MYVVAIGVWAWLPLRVCVARHLQSYSPTPAGWNCLHQLAATSRCRYHMQALSHLHRRLSSCWKASKMTQDADTVLERHVQCAPVMIPCQKPSINVRFCAFWGLPQWQCCMKSVFRPTTQAHFFWPLAVILPKTQALASQYSCLFGCSPWLLIEKQLARCSHRIA